MKRIYLSLLIIFATVISVVGITYAYFTSNSVKITGISFATGSPSMEISLDGQIWNTSVAPNDQQISNMFPGNVSDQHYFYLKDNGPAGIAITSVVPVISGTPSGDWDDLKGGIEAKFVNSSGNSTDWKSLSYWQTNTSLTLPSLINLTSGARFEVQYQIPTGIDSSGLQGKMVSGLEWDFVGRTQ